MEELRLRAMEKRIKTGEDEGKVIPLNLYISGPNNYIQKANKGQLLEISILCS